MCILENTIRNDHRLMRYDCFSAKFYSLSWLSFLCFIIFHEIHIIIIPSILQYTSHTPLLTYYSSRIPLQEWNQGFTLWIAVYRIILSSWISIWKSKEGLGLGKILGEGRLGFEFHHLEVRESKFDGWTQRFLKVLRCIFVFGVLKGKRYHLQSIKSYQFS